MTKALGVTSRTDTQKVFEPVMEGDDPYTRDDLEQLKIRLEEDHVLVDRGDGHTRILAPGHRAEVVGDHLIVHAPDGSMERIAAVGDDIVDIAAQLRDYPQFVRSDIEIVIGDVD